MKTKTSDFQIQNINLSQPNFVNLKKVLESKSLRNGLGLFETIKIIENKKICFLEEHLNRLFLGIKFLRSFSRENLNFSEYFAQKQKELKNLIIKDLSDFNQHSKEQTKILRVLYLENLGIYYFFENFRQKKENKQEIKLFISKNFRLEQNSLLSKFKNFNYLKYTLALQEAEKQGFDDSLLLNYQDQVVETSKANLFFRDRNYNWFTPTLKSGCLEGIIRFKLIKILRAKEQDFKYQELSKFEAALICNSVIDLVPVRQIDQHKFTKTVNYREIIKLLYNEQKRA